MSASVTVLDGVVRRHDSTTLERATSGSGPPPVEGKPAVSRTTLPGAAPKAAAQEAAPEIRLREQKGRDWVRRYRTVLPPGSSPAPEPQPAAAEAAPQPVEVEAEASVAEDEPEPEHDDTPGRRGRGHAHGRERDDR